PVAVAEPPRPVSVTVPSGTKIDVRLTQTLRSDENKPGESFEATLDRDLVVDGQGIAPRGSTVTGKLVNVAQSGRVEGRAKMSLTLTDLKTKSAEYHLRTNTIAFEAEGTKKADATKIGGGAALGAIIGAIAGGGKGAAIGAAAGAGAGGAVV